MQQIVRILAKADKSTLVLLDELGAGTDPTEGAALSEAILDGLAASGAKAIATTHLGQLKSYAYTTPRAQNASVQFDRATLGPTYRLLIGTPGSSNALAIAARVGLTEDIIAKAADLLSDDVTAGAELINQVQATREAAERSRDEAQEKVLQAETLRRQVDKELAEVRSQGDRVKQRADSEIDKSMRQVRDALRQYVSAMKNAPKQWRESAEQLGEQIEVLAASTPLAQRHEKFFDALRKGDTVYVITFAREATVDRIRRKRKAVRVILAGKQLEVGSEDICDPEDLKRT